MCLLSAAGGYISIDSITADILPFLFLSTSLESQEVPNEAPNVRSGTGVTKTKHLRYYSTNISFEMPDGFVFDSA